MRQYTNEAPPDQLGTCILFYKDTGSGKTRSGGTCPGPIYLVNNEEKDPRNVLVGCPKPIFYFEFDSIDEEFDQVNLWVEAAKRDFAASIKEGIPVKREFPAHTVFNDGLTFSQIKIKQALEDDRYLVRVSEHEARGMVDRARLERPDWGVSNSLVIRLMGLYNRLSKLGVYVLFTAKEDLFEGVISPAIQGKEVPNSIHGYFDFIGWINRPFHYDGKGNPVYPMITFAPGHHPGGVDWKYVCRTSSDKLMKVGPVPLHWGDIFQLIKEEQRELWEAKMKVVRPVITTGAKPSGEFIANPPFQKMDDF